MATINGESRRIPGKKNLPVRVINHDQNESHEKKPFPIVRFLTLFTLLCFWVISNIYVNKQTEEVLKFKNSEKGHAQTMAAIKLKTEEAITERAKYQRSNANIIIPFNSFPTNKRKEEINHE